MEPGCEVGDESFECRTITRLDVLDIDVDAVVLPTDDEIGKLTRGTVACGGRGEERVHLVVPAPFLDHGDDSQAPCAHLCNNTRLYPARDGAIGPDAPGIGDDNIDVRTRGLERS